MENETKIFVSLLDCDFGKINEEVASVEEHADGVHFDVMDGHYVDNLTMGAPILRKIKTNLPIDVHLMVAHPSRRIPEFIEAGASMVSFQMEGSDNIERDIQMIQDGGAQAGIAIDGYTDIANADPFLDIVDYILVMSVQAGFGKQAFLSTSLDKVRYIRNKKPDLKIEIDGGINVDTVQQVKEAGVDILVSGSYIFGADNRQEAIAKLR